MDITTSAPDPRVASHYLPEESKYGAQAIASHAAAHEARCLAHVIRRGYQAQPRRLTLEEAMPEMKELRELLEENLAALRALYEEQRRFLIEQMQEPGAPIAELHALMRQDAPWVAALDETRQLIRTQFLEVAASRVSNRRRAA